MAALLENFQAGLRHIIVYCTTRETIEYTPSDFTFKGLTIENLDRLMKEYQGIEDIYTLSPMQEGLLFQALVDHSSHSYFEQVALRMEGELDIPLVEKSLNDLFKRHDILRTAFVCKNIDSPIQIVLKERTIDFHYEDIIDIGNEKERALFIIEFKEKDKQRSFDLSKDVLMRVSVFRTAHMEYDFIWSFHHILMDGWCLGILNAEFLNIYHGNLEKEEYRLPAIKPYRSYIQWLEKLDKEESLHYWSSYMASYEEATVIPKKPGIKKEAIAYRNEKVFLVLGKEKTAALNKLAAENRVTLNTMLQVVWGILLGKFNGKEDVVFGAVVSGRPYQLPGVESMVGLFINSIPMRVKFTGGQEFNRLVQIIQQESIAGEPYHYHPLADIQSHGPLKQSLFDHLFIFENYPITEQIEGYRNEGSKSIGASLKITSVDVFDQTHYDFNIILSASDHINITFQYNGNVIGSNFVKQVADRFRLAIDRLIKKKESKVGELTLPSPEEMDRILYEFNNTGAEFPGDMTIHGLFEEQVKKAPDHIAVFGRGQTLSRAHTDNNVGAGSQTCPITLTFNGLNEQSNQLACLLIEKGVLADNIVGIMMERSIEMIIGIYGILKAGGAYLPIDPSYPQERIDYMLGDSNARILLATEECRQEIIVNCQSLFVNYNLKNVRSLQARYHHSSFINHHSNQLAYIIYTSGSTGRPKGVMMRHRAVVNRLNWMQRAYPIDENDVLIQKTPVTFDVSVWELFWWSFYGSSLFLPGPGVEKNPEALVQASEMNRVTTIHFVPSMLNVWLDYIDNTSAFNRLTSLRQVFSSGEALEVYQVVKFNNGIGKINHTRLINLYGPTEACVDVSYFNCWSSVGQNLERIPIGKPIDNIDLYVVSEESLLQPIGIAGELLIAGVGLARGYLNRPELTNQKFLEVQEPFFKKVPGLFYRTGDLARWLPDGNIEFLGRIDHQVKIRGFRIELGEIEARLMDHPWVKEAVVIPRQDRNGDKKLCAYVVLDVAGSAQVGPTQSTIDNELRIHLLKHLPEYMVSPYFVILDKMPLSANGKLDRRALPEPEINAGGEYVGPRDEAEKGIVFIVADILGMDPAKISVRANFFNIGLNSISILKLAQRISEEFRIEFPIGTLFTSPTVEGVVADMKKGYPPGASRRAVLLNRKKASKNLFLISGDGRVYIFKELALLLEGHFNVYGVQGKGFMDTGPLPQTRREVFDDLLHEIKLVQPEGPYILGGHCYGAIISYELARILEEHKEEVAKIVLLDEPALMTDDVMDRLILLRWYNRYRNTVENLERIVKFIETKLREKRHTDREKMPTVKSGSMPVDLEARRIEINKNYNRLFPNPLHYTRIVNSPLLVFKTDQSALGPAPEPRWNPATIARTSRKNVEVVDTAGDHLSMFAPPHVAVLAKQCIERI
ncbi:MAG: hypothetical protein QG657_3902 [Acidobacteriota bacterium]|nr:hypothetical protein [Acidobacteriota bacterium]